MTRSHQLRRGFTTAPGATSSSGANANMRPNAPAMPAPSAAENSHCGPPLAKQPLTQRHRRRMRLPILGKDPQC